MTVEEILNEIAENTAHDEWLAKIGATAPKESPSDGFDEPEDVSAHLINACNLLEEIGQFFDFLTESGKQTLSRRHLSEITSFSNSIYELLQEIEELPEDVLRIEVDDTASSV